jgi:hypothetical protein
MFLTIKDDSNGSKVAVSCDRRLLEDQDHSLVSKRKIIVNIATSADGVVQLYYNMQQLESEASRMRCYFLVVPHLTVGIPLGDARRASFRFSFPGARQGHGLTDNQ